MQVSGKIENVVVRTGKQSGKKFRIITINGEEFIKFGDEEVPIGEEVTIEYKESAYGDGTSKVINKIEKGKTEMPVEFIKGTEAKVSDEEMFIRTGKCLEISLGEAMVICAGASDEIKFTTEDMRAMAISLFIERMRRLKI